MSVATIEDEQTCYACVIEGDVATESRRHREAELFRHLDREGVHLDMLSVNETSCNFVVSERDVATLRATTLEFNVALRLKHGCRSVTLLRTPDDSTFPSVARLIDALDREAIDIVHLVVDPLRFAVVVDERDAERAVGVMRRSHPAPARQTPRVPVLAAG